jgi:TonB-linked SusC/RagA family outer membrane protein
MRKKTLMGFCALVFATITSFAQTSQVTGKVTDEKGAAIAGASVKEKGTRNGISTEQDGTFTLNVKKGSSLVIASLGFESKTVTATENLTIKLVNDVQSLAEVVVTGTGTATSKRKLGISVESINSSKLPSVPAASLDQALVGKIPGAQISSVSGNPGDQVNIVLRGINTIQGGTRPMILMDGVEIPFSNLSTIDLTQVERVEVVQGAASATLYGAQGANGVIQIFTKKGIKGKVAINASTSIAQNSFINSGHFASPTMNPYLTDANGNLISRTAPNTPLSIDPVSGQATGGNNSVQYVYGTDIVTPDLTNPRSILGSGASNSRSALFDPRNQFNHQYVGNFQAHDHYAEVYQTGQSVNNTVNINGGAEKIDYSVSFANNHTTSPLLKDNGFLDRTNVTANLGFELFKGFTIRSVTGLVYSHNNMHPQLGAPGGYGFGNGKSNADVTGVYGFMNTMPFYDLTQKNTDGYYIPRQVLSSSGLNAGVNSFNPFYRLAYTTGESKRYDIMQNFEANYKINHFVNLNAKYGVTYRNENDQWTYLNQSANTATKFWPVSKGYFTAYKNYNDFTGDMVNWQYSNVKQNFMATATVNTDFQKDFKLNVPITTTTLIGFDYRKNQYRELDVYGSSLPPAPPINLTSTQSQSVLLDYVEPFITYGYVVDQKFDWANHAGITAGVRSDYSSAFGSGSKPFTFPHFNGYVNLSSFNFWGNLEKAIPQFKIRAAYGKAGIQPNAFDRFPGFNNQPTSNQLAYTTPTSQANSALNVEVSQETEVGTDLSFHVSNGNWLKSINAGFTYWTRKTDNAIYTQTLPPSTGATSILTNAIGLSSNGWQLSLNIPVLSSKDLTWDFTANFGHQTSTITHVAGGDIPVATSASEGGSSAALVLSAGRKIGEIYGYKALTSVGELRADGKTPFIDPTQQANYSIVNGRVVNNIRKTMTFSDEYTSFGDANPTLTSSYINSFNYKGYLTFGFQVDWNLGSHLYNATKEWMYRDANNSDYQKPVTINGQTGGWTAYYVSAYYATSVASVKPAADGTNDYFYENSSFARLRNIYIGVDLARFIKEPWLKKCQLVLSGRNLVTITKYSGMDPEMTSGQSNSAFDRGVDYTTLPNMKSYQATLNIGF